MTDAVTVAARVRLTVAVTLAVTVTLTVAATVAVSSNSRSSLVCNQFERC